MSDPLVRRDAERFIPVARPTIGNLEKENVAKVLASGQISQGPIVAEFEREFAEAHGRKFGVAVNSGTSALHLSLLVAGGADQRANREEFRVACPAMTMVACPNAILSAGGVPIFVDSRSTTGNIDLGRVRIPGPHAAIFVHLYGVPVEFRAESDRIIRSRWPAIIEDCCEAHYARFADGTPVGSRGDFACFSFFSNKIVCCGEGGMILTDDADAADRLRGLRAHAFSPGEHFNHREHAYGLRMTEMQAAVGLAQHWQREEFIQRRSDIAARYFCALHRLNWIELPHRPAGSADWVFPLNVRDGFGHITRDHVRASLAEKGVESRTYFKPMHQQKFLSRFAAGQEFPVAEDLARRGLYLPLFASMTDDECDYICEILSGLRP